MSPDDQAQALELAEYQRTQQRAILPQGKSLSHCEECGDEIPLERQKAMFVTRCVYCQEELEIIKSFNAMKQSTKYSKASQKLIDSLFTELPQEEDKWWDK